MTMNDKESAFGADTGCGMQTIKNNQEKIVVSDVYEMQRIIKTLQFDVKHEYHSKKMFQHLAYISFWIGLLIGWVCL